jgi:hypothetical protein
MYFSVRVKPVALVAGGKQSVMELIFDNNPNLGL